MGRNIWTMQRLVLLKSTSSTIRIVNAEDMTFGINLRNAFTYLPNTIFRTDEATELIGVSVNRDTLDFRITRLVAGKRW